MSNNVYNWTFASVGRAVRVKIKSGEDIAHLGELDRKMWTVLSCPVNGLEFDATTLRDIDSNSDGLIHVDEVISAAKWITGILKNPDDLLKGEGQMKLDDFNTDNPEGATLQKSARQILANLGEEKDSIGLEDTADNAKIFAGTPFNGDGVITEFSSADLAELIKKIAAVTGGTLDRSGVQGITAEQIEAFYTACADYAAWKEAVVAPYGESTDAAMAAVEAVKAKVADFFMRCKLIGFDADASAAVDVDVEKIKAISSEDLASKADEIALHPLARPNAKGVLPLVEGVNPAWQGAVANLHALVFPKADSISEADWNEAIAKFEPYVAWLGAKKGAEVESLGIDDVKAILKAAAKEQLLALIEQDKALEAEALSIETVDKVLHLRRDFYSFLCNYVVFSDFYEPDKLAIFQAGQLYIDQRRCDLCVKVSDMGKQGDMAGLSGMYILYCSCVSKTSGKSFIIAAVLTNGETRGLRVGKNAIFYDRAGEAYDATVTKIIDNPVSIRQAFWAPYRKFGNWISGIFAKKVEDKNDKGFADMTSAAKNVTETKPGEAPKPVQSSFDIAKFAGIFAAIGMALGFIGQALVKLAEGAAKLGLVKVLIVIVAIMLVISLPSCILAWIRLRKRDLGPVLNANGWAINASSYVNVKFGATLTQLAKYPSLVSVDPEARKKARGNRILTVVVVLLLLACGAYFGRKAVIKKREAKVAAQVEVQASAPADSTAAATIPAEDVSDSAQE